jgi:hypothetical protein
VTRKRVRKFWPRAAALGFLGAGLNPVPAPQVQLEEVNRHARIKKDAESGDPEQ